MNTFDEIEEPVVLSPDGRKRRRTQGNPKRAKDKQMRHSGGGKIPVISCTQDTVENVCMVGKLTNEDIAKCSIQFYYSNDKVAQDAALLSYLQISKPKHCRIDDEARKCPRHVSTKYYLLPAGNTSNGQVCRKTFGSVLDKL